MVDLYVLAYLTAHNKVFLIRRAQNRSFAPGLYHMPGGRVEKSEPALLAIQRELCEELDLIIPALNFTLVHTFHRNTANGSLIALVFKADITGLTLVNKEPDKHDAIAFFSLNQLPENMIPVHKQAIECVKKNIYYSEHNW